MSGVPDRDGAVELLARRLRTESARPLLTYYDLAAGGRVELSVATFDNWVAKTCGLLTDELAVEPGDSVSVVLPAHWLGMVWAMAVWTVGGHLSLEPRDDAAVSVGAVGEPVPTTGEVVVVSVLPLGGPAGAAAEPGALDYGREVLGFPDVFGPATPSDDPLLADMMHGVDASSSGRRRLVVADRLDAGTVQRGLLGALAADGSTVLVRPAPGPLDRKRLAEIAREERAVPPG